MAILRLFHRTSREAATSILRNGFKGRCDPTGRNYGFYDQIPEINAVWFGSVPLDANEGAACDVLFLIEIPDEVAQPYEFLEEGRGFTEYAIPAEVANQYGPPIDITDSEEDYDAREWPRPE